MAGFSPRKTYLEQAKRLGVQDIDILPTDRQQEHVMQQINEMRIIINRNLVDLTGLVNGRNKAKDTAMVTAFDSKIVGFSSDIQQLVDKLALLNQLQKELEGQE
jgi:hypothetical protein